MELVAGTFNAGTRRLPSTAEWDESKEGFAEYSGIKSATGCRGTCACAPNSSSRCWKQRVSAGFCAIAMSSYIVITTNMATRTNARAINCVWRPGPSRRAWRIHSKHISVASTTQARLRTQTISFPLAPRCHHGVLQVCRRWLSRGRRHRLKPRSAICSFHTIRH